MDGQAISTYIHASVYITFVFASLTFLLSTACCVYTRVYQPKALWTYPLITGCGWAGQLILYGLYYTIETEIAPVTGMVAWISPIYYIVLPLRIIPTIVAMARLCACVWNTRIGVDHAHMNNAWFVTYIFLLSVPQIVFTIAELSVLRECLLTVARGPTPGLFFAHIVVQCTYVAAGLAMCGALWARRAVLKRNDLNLAVPFAIYIAIYATIYVFAQAMNLCQCIADRFEYAVALDACSYAGSLVHMLLWVLGVSGRIYRTQSPS